MALYAFDGTWNRRDTKAGIERVPPPRYGSDRSFRRDTLETNVHRFCEFYGEKQTEYVEGVGTRFGWLGAALGGLSGLGGKRRIRKMYLALVGRYVAGDHEIDIIGFSRGAALAIHFAHVIDRFELPSRDDKRHFLCWYYRELGLTWRFPKLRRRSTTNTDDPHHNNAAKETTEGSAPRPIRFLGLWDAVATFGLPIKPFRNKWARSWCLDTVPAGVDRSFHAMALDEVRSTFELVRPTRTRERGQQYEVWFRGVHSNVGGSYPDRGLSDIALAWMIEMYIYSLHKRKETPPKVFEEALGMLIPEPGPVPAWVGRSFETLEPNPDGELGRPLDLRRAAWREMPAGALVHHSVYRRTKNQLLDHYRSNLSLLRTLPGDALPVYDPPLFYSDTPRVAARKLGLAAFQAVPVRPSWFKVGSDYVFRSDDWVAGGQDRNHYTKAAGREAFLAIATEWLLANKTLPLSIATPLLNHYREPFATEADRDQMTAWVVNVLTALETYVPGLKTFR